jgi:hypothetical protein
MKRVTPSKSELLELADRHKLALTIGDADPGFHLSNDDMRTIEWALRDAANRATPTPVKEG